MLCSLTVDCRYFIIIQRRSPEREKRKTTAGPSAFFFIDSYPYFITLRNNSRRRGLYRSRLNSYFQSVFHRRIDGATLRRAAVDLWAVFIVFNIISSSPNTKTHVTERAYIRFKHTSQNNVIISIRSPPQAWLARQTPLSVTVKRESIYRFAYDKKT